MNPAMRKKRGVPVSVRRGGAPTYLQKLLSYSPLEVWPLNETTTTTTATALVSAARNGAYSSNTIPNQTTWTDGAQKAPNFVAASTHRCNIYTASLASGFNGVAGTMAIWARGASGFLTDGAFRRMIYLNADANNFLMLTKSSVNNRVDCTYRAGGTFSERLLTSFSITDWFHLAITWDKNAGASGEFKAYLNGVQQSTTATGLGIWAGSLSSTACVIGANDSAGANRWNGNLWGASLWTVALSASEVADIADPLP